MKSRYSLALAILVVGAMTVGTSSAMSPFKKAFDAKYVKESGNEEFQAVFRKTGCNTCHVKGEKKHVLNAYGWQLSQRIDGLAKDRIDAAREQGIDAKKTEELKVLKELEAALVKVEQSKSPAGKSYGELFEGHQLPTADGAKSIRD